MLARSALALIALLLLATAASLSAPPAKAPAKEAPPLRVLILTGRNNHDWKATTPVLEKIFQDCPRFTVDVTLKPEKLDAATLAKYDVLVSNWSNWPNIKERSWGPVAEKAFLDFLRAGKGFVVIHAAATAFGEWDEFKSIVGSWWELGKTGHGRVHEFTVRITDTGHPVTQGMKPFATSDELWHRSGKYDKLNVLCTAFADKAKGGSGADEPVVHWRTFGKGRIFHLILGHHGPAIQNVGFRTLLLRGSEWAATEKVTVPIPTDWPAPKKDAPPKKPPKKGAGK